MLTVSRGRLCPVVHSIFILEAPNIQAGGYLPRSLAEMDRKSKVQLSPVRLPWACTCLRTTPPTCPKMEVLHDAMYFCLFGSLSQGFFVHANILTRMQLALKDMKGLLSLGQQ